MEYKATFMSNVFSFKQNIEASSDIEAVENAKSKLSELKEQDVMPNDSVLWEVLKDNSKIWQLL
ncbi:MAG: hypothetical protein ACOYLO_00440 [Ferruginibacter sp.]